MLRASSRTVHRARALRRSMTLPEILLWRALRERPGGFKFRKQHPIGEFVLDFYCVEATSCIEVDGEAHDRGDQPMFDTRRADWLSMHTIATLRINATDVLGNLEGVVTRIVQTALMRLPRCQPSAGTGKQ